jgi:hypothetical protein
VRRQLKNNWPHHPGRLGKKKEKSLFSPGDERKKIKIPFSPRVLRGKRKKQYHFP